MIKKLIITLSILFITNSCYNKNNINLRHSTELVRFQTKTLADYNNGVIPAPEVLKKMKNNLWVAAAAKIAPSNIVIRQFCLLDILEGEGKRHNEIYNIIDILSGKSDKRIWLEGYSYWVYTRDFLDVWIKKFDNERIKELITQIDEGFILTAYFRNGKYYPVPMGDVKDTPLAQELQNKCNLIDNVEHGNVRRKRISFNEIDYIIKSAPIGLNIHVPLTDHLVQVINGTPVNYKYYTSINDKYPDNAAYAADVLHPKRIKSIEGYSDSIIKIYLYGE